MNDFIYQLELDLNCRKTAPQIASGQFDRGRKIEIKVLSDDTEFNVSDCTAVLKGVRRDKTNFALPCTIDTQANRVIAEIDDTTFSVAGLTVAKLVLSDSNKSFSTQIFTIIVGSSLDGDITKDDNYSILNRLIEQVHMLDDNGAVLIGNGTIVGDKIAAGTIEAYCILQCGLRKETKTLTTDIFFLMTVVCGVFHLSQVQQD